MTRMSYLSLKNISEFLSKSQASGVSSAEEAFIVLTNQHFDFLLCDVVVPGNKNGKDLADQALQY